MLHTGTTYEYTLKYIKNGEYFVLTDQEAQNLVIECSEDIVYIAKNDIPTHLQEITWIHLYTKQ